jgi:hypothetical protein
MKLVMLNQQLPIPTFDFCQFHLKNKERDLLVAMNAMIKFLYKKNKT